MVAGGAALGGAASTAAPPETLPVRSLPGTRAAAATLIVQGIAGGSLPFAAIALPEKAVPLAGSEEGSDRVRLPIEIELPAALDVAAGTEVELYAYALDAAGGVAAHRGLAVTLPEPRGAGLRVVAHLDLAPGAYSVRFLVLESTSHRFSLVRREVEVGPSTSLGTPRFDDACPAWSLAGISGSTPANRAARPVLIQGRTIRLTAAAPASLSTGTAAIRARLTPTSAEAKKLRTFETRLAEAAAADDRREPVLDQPPHYDRQEAALDAAPSDRLELEFDLPPIGRGVWELRLEASGKKSAELVSPAVEVWVVDPDDLGGPESDPCARTWSAVLARALGDPAAPPIAGAPEPTLPDSSDASARVERRRAETAYEEVLALLASTSDVDQAVRALCRFEESFTADLQRLPLLQRAEIDVARRLGQREPEVLAPLMLLHHQAYLEHRERVALPLAGHSSRVVHGIGELIVDHPDRVESGILASRILTSLAEHGHRHRSFVPSQRLLEVALDIEPENPGALKLLAVSYEWLGRYDEAEALLERLLAVTGADREARLRLGILLERAGRTAAAEGHFRRVVAAGAEPWVLSLAYQQLGTLLLDGGRIDEALEMLERGRARLPDDQALHILSAHALERAGRIAEASRLFEELPIDGTAGSPRLRYGDSMTAPLEALREDIRRAAAVRMPLLGRALAGDGRRRGAR